jgi:hypothetical protein
MNIVVGTHEFARRSPIDHARWRHAGEAQGERSMRHRNWLIAAASAVALGFIAMPSQAAPVATLDGLKATGENEVQLVHRRYRKYRHREYYGYGPGVHFYVGPSRRHHHHHHHRRHHHH